MRKLVLLNSVIYNIIIEKTHITKMRDFEKYAMQISSGNRQWPQWLATISGCFGIFCGGMCFAWSSPSLAILQSNKSPFPVSNSEASWIAAFLQLGAAFGAIFGSLITKRLGPKTCTLISAIPYLTGFAFIIFATNPQHLYISRIFCGIAIGFSFTSIPIYVAEVSENHNRGSLLITFGLMLNTGSMFVTGIAPYTTLQTMAEIMSAFPLVMFATHIFAPESPHFYVRRENEENAMKSLSALRRQKNIEILNDEISSIKKHTKMTKISESLREFIQKPNPKAVSIVLLTVVCQQFCGAVPSIFYLEQIYASTQLPFPPNLAVFATSVIANLISFATIPLADHWGRKPLLMMSCIGSIISTTMLSVYFQLGGASFGLFDFYILPIVAVNMLQVFFTFGLSSVPYTIAGEVFSANVKEVAFCVVNVGGSLSGFAASKLFQVASDSLGVGFVFISFTIITILLTIIMYLIIPETKGKSFNEIQEMLKTGSYLDHSVSKNELYTPKSHGFSRTRL